jgi:hypothetical protein
MLICLKDGTRFDLADLENYAELARYVTDAQNNDPSTVWDIHYESLYTMYSFNLNGVYRLLQAENWSFRFEHSASQGIIEPQKHECIILEQQGKGHRVQQRADDPALAGVLAWLEMKGLLVVQVE